jgi:hypothetical protein
MSQRNNIYQWGRDEKIKGYSVIAQETLLL